MDLLEGVIQHYDWGSIDSIPELLGVPVTGEPWAELWFGAHPSAPSSIGSAATPLDELIAADPILALGPAVAARFDGLPFLLKILAAVAPLSLQAHPSTPQAEAGFDREEAAGIPTGAPNRAFRDRNHKPELLCALTEFDALCGFRDPQATLAVLHTIDTPVLDQLRRRLAASPDATGLHALLEHLLGLSSVDAAGLVAPVVHACRLDGPVLGRRERAMVVSLGDRYPDDAGVVTALLLNLVTLAPGEALFLGAGNLHAYLHGTGVEIMASSDNVLRGGLTEKHVDVEALLSVVSTAPMEPVIQRPPVVEGIATYDTPVADFSLQRVEINGEMRLEGGPAILLCAEGTVDLGQNVLDRGEAAWIPADTSVVELSGRGLVFRAGVGPLDA